MKINSTILALTLTCSLTSLSLRAAGPPPPAHPHPVPSIQDTETQEQRDARMAWWREAKFGMFIHWDLGSATAGTWKGQKIGGFSDWIMFHAKIPVADYKAFAPQFNPTKFDADAWVTLAKNAGMKYMVITAKHHDGFAMFHSKADPFNIYDATPFKRDPLAELNVATQKQGIKLGFYYSQDQDWTYPGGVTIKKGHWDKAAQDGNFATYLQNKSIPQLEELLTNYSPAPALLWFDTPTADMTSELAGKIVTLLNKHPNLIWNPRLGGGYKGDYETPEGGIPHNGYPGEDWETCMTTNGTWGYRADATSFMSAETLLRNLIDIVSKGGNYLLNVGPDGTGVIPQPEQDRLLAIGRWLKVNGEAIYGTSASNLGDVHGTLTHPSDKNAKDPHAAYTPIWDWRCTTKPGRMYLHIFQWPTDGAFTLSKVPSTVTKAYLLADPDHAPLKFTQTGTSLSVSVPAKPLDPVATVLVLETK